MRSLELRTGIIALAIFGLAWGSASAQVAPNPPPVVQRPTPTVPTRYGFGGGGGEGRSGLGIGIGVGAAAIGLGIIAGTMRSQPAFGVPSGATIMETRPRQEDSDLQEPEVRPRRQKLKKPRIEPVSRTSERDDTPTVRRTQPLSSQIPQLRVARPRFVVPAASETRYVANEVLVIVKASSTPERLRRLEIPLRLAPLASDRIALIGAVVRRYRLPPGTSVASAVEALRRQSIVAGAQPNYLFELQQDKPAAPPEPAVQYAIDALHLNQAHKLANGTDILVAVIDSGVDETNPELKGAVTQRFDAVGGEFKPHSHGTAIGGTIVAHRSLTGVAPKAKLLAIRAFTGAMASANGTSFDILRGLDYAAAHEARIVNMSFAGPEDQLLKIALLAARKRGIIAIAAAGNGGPLAKPLYPAAEPGVIAVTATDADGNPFAKANRGFYVAVAAPGVNIVAPGLGDSVQVTSGTSIATAEASGVAALLLERRPRATPDEVRKILGDTAMRLAVDPAAVGAGLIDAEKAVRAAK